MQRGHWEGQQLLPEAWVEEATRLHIANAPAGSVPGEDPSDWAQGYGYQFWRCRHGAYRGDGAFGQFCVIMPEEDAVLAITSATMDMQIVLDLVWRHLLPALRARAKPLSEDTSLGQTLSKRLEGLKLPPVTGERSSIIEPSVLGRTYRFEEPAAASDTPLYRPLPNLSGFKLETTETGWRLELHHEDEVHALGCGHEDWLPASPGFLAIYPGPVRVSAAWTANDVFTINILYLETPHTLILGLRFSGDTVRLEPRWSVQFGALELPTLTGRRL